MLGKRKDGLDDTQSLVEIIDSNLDDMDNAAAVGDHAAVGPSQGVCHARGIQHILHRHHIAQQGMGVVLGVVRHGHFDPSQLL